MDGEERREAIESDDICGQNIKATGELWTSIGEHQTGISVEFGHRIGVAAFCMEEGIGMTALQCTD